MPRKIVSTGRGGAGKSTFVALISRYLKPPTLLIDLDPDLSLADMLGFDFHKEGKRTVCEALYDVVGKRKSNVSPSITTHELMESLLWSDCLYEGKKFDLITLGTKLTEGCLCAPDEMLRKTIPKLARNYTNMVVDSPAGVEHLNRNIVSDINDLFVLCDPSDKSLKHIPRIKEIIKQVGIRYSHFYLVANYEFDEEAEEYLQNTGEIYLGKIDYDARLEQYNLEGKSLLELPEDSAASLSVKGILTKAGYQIRS
ncbi:MAG: AAA family ATPase [Dehalococcoidia bacterium]|nr:AAA family ATPase [Dehalococcoidia bacterium]